MSDEPVEITMVTIVLILPIMLGAFMLRGDENRSGWPGKEPPA